MPLSLELRVLSDAEYIKCVIDARIVQDNSSIRR